MAATSSMNDSAATRPHLKARARYALPPSPSPHKHPFPPRLKPPSQVFVWTRLASGSTPHGPLDLSCSVGPDTWQSFAPTDTGLPLFLDVQAGRTCAGGEAGDLGGLRVRYGAQEVVVEEAGGEGGCVRHDNGVMCNGFSV